LEETVKIIKQPLKKVAVLLCFSMFSTWLNFLRKSMVYNMYRCFEKRQEKNRTDERRGEKKEKMKSK